MILEYTFLTFVSVLVAIILDLWILKTRLLTNKKYYIFLIFQILLHSVVDNWLNGRYWFESYIVGPYGSRFFSNIYIWQTPLENYFFGFALILMNISVFEYLLSKKNLKAKL
jgi:lycopene cyclase domain-containing protein